MSLLLYVPGPSFADTQIESSASLLAEPAAALVGKRLFFSVPLAEENSRENMSRGVGATTKNETSTLIDEDTVRDKTTQKKTKPPALNTIKKRPLIRYEARINTKDTIRIIINSVPCHTIVGTSVSLPISATEIHCDELANTGIAVYLLGDQQRLKIMRQSTVLGILAPGQQL